VTVPFFVAAACVHRVLEPHRAYTWMRPAQVLWVVVRTAYFPTVACGAYLLGVASRFDGADARAFAHRLRAQVSLTPYRKQIATAAVAAVVAVVVGAFVDDYVLVDYFALATLAGFAGFRRAPLGDYTSAAKQLALVALLFMAVSYGFTIEKALLFRFRAPHDAQIVALEQLLFGTEPHKAIARWAAARPTVVAAADRVYYYLFHHMAVVSAFFIGARDSRRRAQFLASLALCYWIGGVAYYVWPGAGPGYFDPDTYKFLGTQPLETNYFRVLLYRNTAAVVSGKAGSFETYDYVACMPSLHMAHELVMLYFARSSRLFFFLSFLFTAFTAFAVVALGWHYPIDIVFGAVVAATAIAIAHWQRDRLFPAGVLR
jgi:hypothetical protein